MTDILYKQCRLQKDRELLTTWIPAKFAKQGKQLKAKIDGVWTEGWTVDKAFDLTLTQQELDLISWQYRHTREVTDI